MMRNGTYVCFLPVQIRNAIIQSTLAKRLVVWCTAILVTSSLMRTSYCRCRRHVCAAHSELQFYDYVLHVLLSRTRVD